jgi:hypothetical protein
MGLSPWKKWKLFLTAAKERRIAGHAYWKTSKARAVELARCAVLCRRLNRQIPQPQLRREYRRRLWRLLRTSADPSVLFIFFLKCTVHYHHYQMAEQMSEGKTPLLNPF